MKLAAFTIISKNYLAQARALMTSLSTFSSNVRRIVILADRIDGYFDPAKENFDLILSEQFGIPHSRWFHFKYSIMELNTAVKPYAAEYILEHYGVDRLIYFDPDILLYRDAQPLFDALGGHSVLLTPHLTRPCEDDKRPSDLDILRSGTYNLGFIGLSRGEECSRLLSWWQRKLYDHCVVDLPSGLFVDQRWVDLVPGLFGGVRILRNPGYNLAYWNLAHRQVQRVSGSYEVNGEPLLFFHFSGFDPENPDTFSRHQNRFTLDDLGDAKELVQEYRTKLLESGYAEVKSWPYAYGFFDNGLPIPDIGRLAHHESPEVVTKVDDPFSEGGYQAFLDVWNSPLTGPDGKPSGITRLAYRIYKSRGDVQAAMPDIFNGDLRRFLEWVVSSGKNEHRLSDAFIDPVWKAVEDHSRHDRVRDPSIEKPALPVNERIIRMLSESGIWVSSNPPIPVDSLNRLIDEGHAKLHLSYLAKIIYESRPDLQRYFPDPCGKDCLGFVVWFLTYGADEYGLEDVFLGPLRSQWKAVVESLRWPHQRLWYRTVYAGTALSVTARKRLQALSEKRRLSSRGVAAPSNNGHSPARVDTVSRLPEGVNFIGYVRSEMGVGESVRCAVRAAKAVQLPLAIRSVDSNGPYRLGDGSVSTHEEHCPYRVNVLHVNADESPRVITSLEPEVLDGRYNIGYWAWELEDFPARWNGSFRLYDEIWTPSSFCQTAIARRSPIPVLRMPHSIEVKRLAPADRSSLGISPRDFVFLSIFDLLSVFERKNPLGLLAAFRAAFAGNPGCRLVLKINHASERPAEMQRIREAAEGLPVTLIDKTINREEVSGLIQMADCLVSLHRSEGFGLTLAEAMYLNKPVIATAYSGNMDFTLPGNSFLVSYRLVRVPEGSGPYDAGQKWADPNLDDAVEQMRRVVADEMTRHERAALGRDCVHTNLSPAAVGRLIRERLDVVSRRSPFN